MAKKKSPKPAKKLVKKQPPRESVAPAPAPQIVVFYELHGLAGIRYHSEYVEIERARLSARHLVSSPEVDQAWIIRGVEIVKKGN